MQVMSLKSKGSAPFQLAGMWVVIMGDGAASLDHEVEAECRAWWSKGALGLDTTESLYGPETT